MKEVFIRRKRGLEPIVYLHPGMARFLSSTYGVMLYQEDVMKVAVTLAGYSLADADSLRRAVKVGNSALFAREKHRFVFQKAAAEGIEERTANEIWEQVTRFASYSYCKAHASVYGRLAWLTARLKAHYPREFYAAVLNCHKSMYPKRVFVWDALRHNVPVLPPDINESEIGWTPRRQGIRAGLDSVRGLRDCLVLQLTNERRRARFRDLADLRCRVAFRAGELERLVLAGACRTLGLREQLFKELWTVGRNNRQMALFPAPSPQLPSLLEAELVLTGIPFSVHPVALDNVAERCTAARMREFIGKEVCMVGILDAYKHVHTGDEARQCREMSFVTLEDATGMFELVLFPEVHSRYGNLFHHIGPYRVRGVVCEQWDALTLELRDAECA